MYPSTSPPKPLHVNYIKPHRKTKLVSFIGKQCLVETAETLWDDGAQATVNEAGRAEPGKLRSYREDKVHIVIQRKTPDGPPVYEVSAENGKSSKRVLYRGLLLLVEEVVQSADVCLKKETKSQTERDNPPPHPSKGRQNKVSDSLRVKP